MSAATAPQKLRIPWTSGCPARTIRQPEPITDPTGNPGSPTSFTWVVIPPGLELWYRPEALSSLADNDPVSTWPDSTSNGHDAIQTTASRRPLLRT